MRLNHSVANLPGVGPAYQKRLQKLNISTISDLINHFPSRYLDYSHTTPINKLEPDQEVCLKATLVSLTSVRLPNRKTLQKATVTDSTGSLQLTWFNQPYLTNSLIPKQQYYFTGQVDQFRNQLILNSPDFEPIKKKQLHTNRIIPLYPLTAGISHKWLRHKISLVLSSLTIKEIFPSSLKSSLPIDLNSAYHQIHFPDTQKQLELAQKRLSLNDLISIYLKSALTQLDWQQRSATPITTTPSLHNQLLKKLDFDLTTDQQQAINDVFTDLKQTIPMNRLLQGDVGSGKTIVAVSAALQVVKQGFQTLVLAPTQVLAEQHHQSFSQLLKPFS
jgi:ATP-dependent DNA helicase RecG